MSQQLDALSFPLHGSRLIEASAGTGKTWTIAALYLRLVLGHGGEAAPPRALAPSEILVMTFTRAATRELSSRVRERLVEAAAAFRADAPIADPVLQAIAEGYPTQEVRLAAAHRLVLAAEAMDEAAVFTIDSWCQRMLREHAFDSGSLFDEELVGDEAGLFDDAASDYWRQSIYPLNATALQAVLDCWVDVVAMKKSLRELVLHASLFEQAPAEPLAALVARVMRTQNAELARLKEGWAERADEMARWFEEQLAAKRLSGAKFRSDWLAGWLQAMRDWAANPRAFKPEGLALERLTPARIAEAWTKGNGGEVPACFDRTDEVREALAAMVPLSHHLLSHAARSIARRMAQLKAQQHQFSFSDLTERLCAALQGPNGAALRQRIVAQFPVALVDEFQDTSPEQYRIFDLLYRVATNDPALGLFLIGDPKQSIYGFRGADIHSYLAARRATEGRHYQLGINYRSTEGLVKAANQLFLHAETNFPAAAFRFRTEQGNPLPFAAVGAKGRGEQLVSAAGACVALTALVSADDELRSDDYHSQFAQHCAEHIVGLLNDPQAGFREGASFRRLLPADIAILVRNRVEASAVRRALERRGLPSVYLSDKDSVMESEEAADILRWLVAVANPLDGTLARAAFASATAGLALSELARLAADEQAWEERVEQLKALHTTWQRQGVLSMLRRFIHELGLPARLLRAPGGERRLTNLLHLAELLQQAATQLDGEQALIRWLAEQVAGEGEDGEERVLRLESDAELVKVVTVHKSKGLEYPLVYLPFAASMRQASKKNRSFFAYTGADGARVLDLSRSDAALQALERARIEEDLRLMYVAVTRARHFMWMGVAAVRSGKQENQFHESALGYLLNGGSRIGASEIKASWEQLRGNCDAITVQLAGELKGMTQYQKPAAAGALADAPIYTAQFERDWTVGSFTSLARLTNAAPMRAADEAIFDEAVQAGTGRTEDAPWHRFPRGPVPGNFLHEQLEWMANEGFAVVDDPHFAERIATRIQRAGWENRKDDAIAWLHAVATTQLPPLGAALAEISAPLPEMEFWFPSKRLDARALDRLCSARLLDAIARPALPERQLHGMLKGFADLVFEHGGKYWVVDYKSNALGPGDAAYSRAAMAAAMAEHRYDIQGAIYQLALHRLLRARMGTAYDPAQHLGGALFLFLRGVANTKTRGCYQLAPDLALLDAMDAMFGGEAT